MATARRKRERMAKRRERNQPDPVSAPVREPSPRSTFAVARAQERLAEALPGVVRNRAAERREAKAARAERSASSLTLDQGEAKRSPSRPAERDTPAQPKMRDQLKTCKTRPDNNKSKGGAGTGRPHVPWC